MSLLRISIVVVAFLLQLIASAQVNTNASFTTVNGLPDNNVTCMLTDKQGFIWIGTSNGLCRFDGTHFYTLPKGTLQSNKVAGDLILDLEEDGDYIWAAHRFGLSRINKYSFECANFQNNEPGPRYINRRSIRDIYKDSVGNIWLAGDHQLLQFNRKTNAIISIVDFEKILPTGRNKQVSKIIPNGQNTLMLFLVRGWVKYNIREKAIDTQKINAIPVTLLKGENLRLRSYWNTFSSMFYVAYNKEKNLLAISDSATPHAIGRATNIYVDSNLNILINQEQNLQATIPHGKSSVQESNKSYSLTGRGQPFNFIQYSNSIPCWGSINGFYVANSHLKYLKKYFLNINAKDFLSAAPDILDVNECWDNKWLTATKGGLYLIDKATNSTSSFTRWKDSTIHKIFLLPDKTAWLSTNKNLWHFNPKTGLTKKPIALESYAVSIIHLNNKLVVTTRSDGILIINQNTLQLTKLKNTDNNRQIFSNRITAIKPMPDSDNFIITYNLPGSYSYTNFETALYKPDSIPPEAYFFRERFSLESVLPTHKLLWFGSYLGGVLLYDSLSNSWTNFTTKDGLGNNTVFEILQDNQNRVWLLTDNGLDVYDNYSRRIYNFPIKLVTGGKKGGFINNAGNLIVFDNKNIVEINLADFDLNTSKRNVLLGQVSQGDKQFPLEKYSLNLPYDKNSFAVSFSLQKLDPAIETRYAYRLSADESWKEIGTQTQLNFASLAPGKYQLQIKATDEFGQWKNYSVPFPIVINPPFWKTWWFLLLVFLSAIISTWYIITTRQKQRLKRIQQQNEVLRLKTEQELAIAKERERIIADLHDDVGATLSSIHIYSELAGSLVKAKPAESQEMMGKISQQGKNLLGNMSDIIWSLKPANDEQYSFSTRLLNYSQELLSAKHIQTHFAIDELLATQITNPQVRKNILLIAKEAMNNIAKYSNATTAIITLEKSETMIVLRIEDNGEGFDITKGKQGNGIHNMQHRCQQLKGFFEISSSSKKGTSLACHFPIAIISHTG